MALPNPLFVLNGPDSTHVVRLSGAQLNTLNTTPVEIMPAVPGRIIIPTRLLDAFTAGTVSFAGTFAGTWQWIIGTVNFGCAFGMMINAATLADDLESQAVWDPACNTDGEPVSGLLPAVGQSLFLSNAADFTGSEGIATSSLDAGGAGYAPGDTFDVTGGGGTGSAGVVDTVFNGVFDITDVDQGTKTFTVAGDQSSHFTALDSVDVNGSTGNDGTYTVVSATFVTDHTDIVVAEAIPSAVADGNITSVDNGAVLTYHLTSSGTGYTVGSGVATTATTGAGDDNFTINILTVGDGNGTLDLLLEYRILKVP